MSVRHAYLRFVNAELEIEVARSAKTIEEAQELRHRVFCVERQLFNAVPGLGRDIDNFDAAATHIVIRRTNDGEVIATTRIVRPKSDAAEPSLPMFNYCPSALFENLPLDTMGEISRFAISKSTRGTEASGPAIRLLLLRGILQASMEQNLTHWCALMEPSLIRLLSMTGLHFSPLGPLVAAYGLRQPCVAVIDSALSYGRLSHPHIYDAVATETALRVA